MFSKEDFVQFDTIEYEGNLIYIKDSDNLTPTDIDVEKILAALLECRRQTLIDRKIQTVENLYTINLSLKNDQYINIVLSETGDYMYTGGYFTYQRLTNTEKLREVLSKYK